MAVDVTSTGDVEFVVEDGGRVMHPPLLQVGTLDETVRLDVVCDHSPGVSCDRETLPCEGEHVLVEWGAVFLKPHS